MPKQYIKFEDLEISTKVDKRDRSLATFSSKEIVDNLTVKLSITFNRVYSHIYDTTKQNREVAKFEDWTPDEALQRVNEYFRVCSFHQKNR